MESHSDLRVKDSVLVSDSDLLIPGGLRFDDNGLGVGCCQTRYKSTKNGHHKNFLNMILAAHDYIKKFFRLWSVTVELVAALCS